MRREKLNVSLNNRDIRGSKMTLLTENAGLLKNIRDVERRKIIETVKSKLSNQSL
jgi:hypothetical protein